MTILKFVLLSVVFYITMSFVTPIASTAINVAITDTTLAFVSIFMSGLLTYATSYDRL